MSQRTRRADDGRVLATHPFHRDLLPIPSRSWVRSRSDLVKVSMTGETGPEDRLFLRKKEVSSPIDRTCSPFQRKIRIGRTRFAMGCETVVTPRPFAFDASHRFSTSRAHRCAPRRGERGERSRSEGRGRRRKSGGRECGKKKRGKTEAWANGKERNAKRRTVRSECTPSAWKPTRGMSERET